MADAPPPQQQQQQQQHQDAQGEEDPDRPTHSTHTFNVPYRPVFTPRDTPRERPKITPIPKITPANPPSQTESPASGATAASTTASTAASLAEGLEGKYVDEFGNILDWDGTVLGRVEGDLPSMIGRSVTQKGEVLDTEGEVVGYVSDNYAKPPLKELDGGLRVDAEGNIYNQDGSVIGRLNEPPANTGADAHGDSAGQGGGRAAPGKPCSCAAPKPASAPSPSEIYLDVKSTFDGIQLIIKIPTILNQDREGSEREREWAKDEEHRHQQKRSGRNSSTGSSSSS